MTNPPRFKGYLPIDMPDSQPVVLNYEEYEAIRLTDFLLHSQASASSEMGISRPTFTRIYESARRKVAHAFVEASPIIFEGGKVYFDSEWYSCLACGCAFNHPKSESIAACCALCGSLQIEQYSGAEQFHEPDTE